MSECRRTVERLTPYVDRSLAPADCAEVERHLAKCPPCQHAATEEEGGRTVLREGAPLLRQEPLPQGLRARCQALAREHASQPGRRSGQWTWSQWRARFVPVSVTAVLAVMAMLALFSFVTRQSDIVLAAQLAADHAKCFKVFVGAGDQSLDSQAVEAMLAQRYGWHVHVPPSSPGDSVQLVGARRCLYADGRVPHLMYRLGGQDVSLFVLDGVTRSPRDLVALGHRSRIWSRGERTYVMVSPGDGVDATEAVRYVMREAR